MDESVIDDLVKFTYETARNRVVSFGKLDPFAVFLNSEGDRTVLESELDPIDFRDVVQDEVANRSPAVMTYACEETLKTEEDGYINIVYVVLEDPERATESWQEFGLSTDKEYLFGQISSRAIQNYFYRR